MELNGDAKSDLIIDPGHCGGDYFYMHRLSGNMTANIVEYRFRSNATDTSRLFANQLVKQPMEK